MNTPFKNKSTIEDIRNRFDTDVERFSNIDTGQQSTIDATISMELITEAAALCCPDAKNILDIGCGAGNNTIKLLKKINTFDCDLIDLSLPMLERAKNRIAKINTGSIKIYQEDIRTVCLNKEYDIILAAAVLHHLRDDSDWENVFLKLYKLTKPGGSLWITDLVSQENNNIQGLMWNKYSKYLQEIGGKEYQKNAFHYIDKEDSPRPVTYQLNLLRKVGFSQVEILHKNSCFAAFGAIK